MYLLWIDINAADPNSDISPRIGFGEDVSVAVRCEFPKENLFVVWRCKFEAVILKRAY
ncbi:Uncharacterised protein [uncultured archaeon]|nr:Uncharacterised protein [uncultured archaeon]